VAGSTSPPTVRPRDARILAVGVALLIATASILLLAEATSGRLGGFDRWVMGAMRQAQDRGTPLGPPWLPSVARDLTALGSHVVIILFAAIATATLAVAGQTRAALRVASACCGAILLSAMLKAVFGHPRPDFPALIDVTSPSFPSGHALLAAAFHPTLAVVIAARTARRTARTTLIVAALALAALVGITRVYLGVHYPSEVLAGWIAGLSWAFCCAIVEPRAEPQPAAEAQR
jgi:undecaprenyl-diphosphatase